MADHVASEFQEGLRAVAESYATVFANADDEQSLRSVNARFVGPQGQLTRLMKLMPRLEAGDRRAFGRRANELKSEIQRLFRARLLELAGQARRRELSARLRTSARPLAVHGRVGTLIGRLARGASVRRLFTVVTRRRRYPLRIGRRAIGEVALDDTVVTRAGRRRRALARVEIEARPGAERIVRPWVAALAAATGLRPAATSKFEAGLRACRLRPPPLVSRARRAPRPR